MSRQNRATPPQIKVSHLSPDAPVAGRGPSGGGGVAAGWWRVSRYCWVPKTDRATGGCRSYYQQDTKEYLNQRGTKIRVFRVSFRTPFLPPFFPHFSPLFPLQALCILAPLLPSSPPPSPPLFWLPEKSDLGTPLI